MSLEKFHFTTNDKVNISVPFYLDAVKRKDMRKLQKAAKEVGGFENLEDDLLLEAAHLDKETVAQLDELSLREYQDFMAGWMEQSKVGESPAS